MAERLLPFIERHIAAGQPQTIRVDVEQMGSCELDVRDGVAYMPAVTVQDIVNKSFPKPQPPKPADSDLRAALTAPQPKAPA